MVLYLELWGCGDKGVMRNSTLSNDEGEDSSDDDVLVKGGQLFSG